MKEIAHSRIEIGGTLQDLSAGYLSLAEVDPVKLRVRDERYRWLYVLQGQGEAIDEETELRYALRPGALFFRCPGSLHSVIRDTGREWREFFLSLPTEVYAHLSALGVIRPTERFRQPGNGASLRKAARAFYQTLQNRSTPCGIFRALLALFESAEESGPAPELSLTQRALTLLEDSPQTRLQDLARQLGISPDYFCRLVQRQTGLTPVQYRIRDRLSTAQTLLRETELSIDAIAGRLGYPDRFTFSRQFTHYMKIPPAAFRRQGGE